MITRVAVSTSSENQAALGLYTSLGFQTVDQATLYRLPALLERASLARLSLRIPLAESADPGIHCVTISGRTNPTMARRTLNRRELRAEAEAAEAMGLTNQPEPRRAPRAEREPCARSKPVATPKMRVVWAVCDVGGRTVATFDYPAKADAEALVARLKVTGQRDALPAFDQGTPSAQLKLIVRFECVPPPHVASGMTTVAAQFSHVFWRTSQAARESGHGSRPI